MTIANSDGRRIQTLYDLCEADTVRTEAGLPANWITVACRHIRLLPWYSSTAVNKQEHRLKSLPWWYSLLKKDKAKKSVTEEQRVARAANIRRARKAKARYGASYVADRLADVSRPLVTEGGSPALSGNRQVTKAA